MGISAGRLRALGVSVLALCLCAGAAQAAPDNGFGLYLGGLSSSDSSLYGNSHGGLIAVDTQFIVNDHWSLNPYLLLSDESTDTTFSLINGEGGLQARYWPTNNWFLSAEFLFHDSLLERGGTVGSSVYGPGLGIGAGWESDSHWTVMLTVKYMSMPGTSYSSLSYRSEAMLLIGYHWY